MSEERRRILEMLAQGAITAEEADQLLGALGATAASEQPAAARNIPSRRARYLRVLVEDGRHDKSERVNIRVPLQLLRAGIKLAAIIPQEAQVKVDEAFASKGMRFKLSDLTPEMMDELIEGLADLTIDVDGDEEKVRIFCE